MKTTTIPMQDKITKRRLAEDLAYLQEQFDEVHIQLEQAVADLYASVQELTNDVSYLSTRLEDAIGEMATITYENTDVTDGMADDIADYLDAREEQEDAAFDLAEKMANFFGVPVEVIVVTDDDDVVSEFVVEPTDNDDCCGGCA
jgi:uncharacterized protein YoxC